MPGKFPRKGHHGKKVSILPGTPGAAFTGADSDTELSAFSSDPSGLWRTADGTVMRIVDMSDNHLANARNMVGGRVRVAHERWSSLSRVLNFMSKEVIRRRDLEVQKERAAKAKKDSEEKTIRVKAERAAQRAYQAAMDEAKREMEAPKEKATGRKFREV